MVEVWQEIYIEPSFTPMKWALYLYRYNLIRRGP